MLHRLTALLLAQFCCVALMGCTRVAEPELVSLSGDTMGTTFSVSTSHPMSTNDLNDLKIQILENLNAIEEVASNYRDSSEVSRFNSGPYNEWLPISEALCSMLSLALQASEDSGGAFDITVGPLVELWGFGKTSSTTKPPSTADIDLARSTIGSSNIDVDCRRNAANKTRPNLAIDLSGWAKGYAVDQIAVQLERLGLQNFIVEVGGEIRAKGRPDSTRNFVVAIENPLSPQHSHLPRIKLVDGAIATSGNYRNFFEFDGRRYSHTIDPRTGWPTTHNLEAVTVMHPSAAYADALATALLVLGPREGPSLANTLGLAAYFAESTEDGLRYYASSKLLSDGHLLSE